MSDSLNKIKTYNTIDLDNFEIRGARIGVNNAQTTGPLYVQGQFTPSKDVFDGTAVFNTVDTTVTGIAFNYPFSGYDASILLNGDTINAGADTLVVDHQLSTTSVVVQQAPSLSGIVHPTFRLIDREYLIEPDIIVNTTTGLATFVSGNEYVTGSGTSWLAELAPGDSIQLNSYQVYFIIESVLSNTSIKLTRSFTGISTTGFYTTKRWRLGRLDYQYTKNDFIYAKNKAKWTYDTTTGGGLTAYDYFTSFQDGIQLKFSDTLTPTTAPDLMDSNLVLNKTLTKSLENPLYQYSLPVVPDPEESFQLFLNDIPKDKFPDGDMDYILNYWQTPVYQYPPPMSERRIASVMPLQAVQNVTLNPADTASGTILFRDSNGNTVPGVMPGSETILFDGTRQIANEDYVINLNTGVGYASQHNANEAVVKYIAYQESDLFDYGINFSLDGTQQRFTIPHNDADQILFEFESGRFKPADKDNPAMGEEYIIEYLSEGDFISDEAVRTSPGMTWFTTKQYPVKFQNAIVSKNGIILNENLDYRISYLTGRIVFFTAFVRGDSITVSYSPLIPHKNGITYENKTLYCKVYEAVTPVTNISPPEFTLTNQNMSTMNPEILRIHNETKGFDYDITDYVIAGLMIHLQPNATNRSHITELTDVVLIDYKFESAGVEYTPVQYINFFVPAGSNFLAFIDQNVTSLFPANSFIRLTDVESAGDYFFRIQSSSYDGYDTVVQLYGQVPVDLNNPTIYVSDAPISNFLTFPQTATSIASGNTNIYFPGINISRTFRIGQLLQLGDDYYYVQDTQYDQTHQQNVVTINTKTFQDYTTASVLSNVGYSDCPLYYEGDTIINPAMSIIDDPQTPAMTLNYDGLVTITSDSTAFMVDTGIVQYSFPYSTYQKVSQLASELIGLGISVNDYTPDWTSSKIIPIESAIVTKDSTTLVAILPELRLFTSDTTQFLIVAGQLILNNPLVRYQRYSLDYLGKKPLDDTTVEFSASYFSIIPAKTKVSASFKFDNLDQFYIQATSQRRFLDEVIEPRMKDEAMQQSGNVGQGGDVPGDTDLGNSSGGLVGDEYRRVDAVITCHVFKKIFDFYNERVRTYGDEVYAGLGWKLCNNDGLINAMDESCGTKSVNRMFPWADYTNFPPYKIMPLTGQAMPYATMGPYQPPVMLTSRARFTMGSSTVTCSTQDGTHDSLWTKQLRIGDYIRPFDGATNYQIQSITNDTTLALTVPYDGSFVNEPFIMTSKFPLYNDDGFTGGKVAGTVSDGFDLIDQDKFVVFVDGVEDSTRFVELPFPLSLFYSLSNLTGQQIANSLTKGLRFTNVTYEWVEDPTTPFGYRSVLVLRTRGSGNKISIGDNTTMLKLGFTSDTTVFGNNVNPTLSVSSDPSPEYAWDMREYNDLTSEASLLNTVRLAGIPNYLDRQLHTSFNSNTDVSGIRTLALDESSVITIELIRDSSQLASLSKILLEPTMAGYADSSNAYNTDMTFYGVSRSAQIYDGSFTAYYGQPNELWWVLDIHGYSQAVNWKDTTGKGVPNPGPGYTSINGERTFFIHVDNDGTNDKRFLNATLLDTSNYSPIVYFVDTGTQVDGTWNAGWDPSVSSQYSTSANNITFEINDSTPQFVMAYSPASFSYQVTPTSMIISWNGLYSKTYPFGTYSTIGSLRGIINTLAGITASGSSPTDSTLCTALQTQSSTPMTLGVGIPMPKNPTLMFTMFQDSTRNYNYSVDATALNLEHDGTPATLYFSTYTSILSLRTQVDAFPGLGVTSVPSSDSSGSSILAPVSVTAVGGSAPLYDQTYSLFTLTNDGTYNHVYSIDKTGISMFWDGSSNLYSYSLYTTVGAMKTGINQDVPGINANGSGSYDSIPASFKPIGPTLIPPDASVYPALRPCYVYASTMDSKLLLDRSNFVVEREVDMTTRFSFLNTRYTQIVNAFTNEEHFRSIDGSTGNLYNWADNRFNRSNGCEARLKQIEKQMEMNLASLDVSKRFL
jgi:hypothetical protein